MICSNISPLLYSFLRSRLLLACWHKKKCPTVAVLLFKVYCHSSWLVGKREERVVPQAGESGCTYTGAQDMLYAMLNREMAATSRFLAS